jgi:hypothetical protein
VKLKGFILLFIGLLSVGIFTFYSYHESVPLPKAESEPDLGRLENSKKDNLEPENSVDDKAKTAHVTHEEKIPYDGEWCMISADLTEKDQQFAMNELSEWNVIRGNLILSGGEAMRAYSEANGAHYVEPYREMSLDNLRHAVKNDDRFAMISALQRFDVSLVEKDAIADRLLIIDSNKFSLLHKVNREIGRAVSLYENNESNKILIKDSIKNALVYSQYGLKSYDISPMRMLLTMIKEELPRDYLPSTILSSKDIVDINRRVDVLSEQLDEERTKEGFQVLSNIDIPKIAKHWFNMELGVLYIEHEQELKYLSALDTDGRASLKPNECTEQYVGSYR